MYVFVFVQYQMEDNINDSIGMALTSCLVPIHVEDGNNPATPSPINVQKEKILISLWLGTTLQKWSPLTLITLKLNAIIV